jgi:arsenate reductase
MKKIKALFICTGNSCRSQMAEGFLNQYEGIKAYSAGTQPASEVNPLAIEVMQESGIDISSQQPQMIDDFTRQEFDYVITVCDAANESCPAFLGKVKNRLHFSFEDPAGKSIEVFRRVRDEIKAMTAGLAENIREGS